MNTQTTYEAALIVAHGNRPLSERKAIALDLAATMPDVDGASILRHLDGILSTARTIRARKEAIFGAASVVLVGCITFLATVAWAFQVAPMA